MKTIVANYAILYVLLLVYIYSLVFDFFPISTKIILEVIGLFYCTKQIISPHYTLKKDFRIIIFLISLLVIWDILISITSGNSEYIITKSCITLLGSFFGSELIYRQFRKLKCRQDNFFYHIIIVIAFVSLLAIIMKAVPSVYEFLESFLVFEFGDLKLEYLARLFGIGNAIYFGVLPSCTVGVMCSVYCISREKSFNKLVLLFVIWFLIAIVSFLIARWALLIVGFSCLYFLYCQKSQNLGKLFSRIFGLGLVALVAFYILLSFMDEKIYSWAFSFMVNKKNDDGSLQTVMNWWFNTSFSLQTLLFGDARYTNSDGSYYNHVDVGVFRQIFYGGVVYLYLNILLHLKILKIAYRYNRTSPMKGFLYFSMFAFVGTLAKGDASMATFFILYSVYFADGLFDRTVRKLSIKNKS